MLIRRDLLDGRCPEGMEIVQLSHEGGAPFSHIYMEAQIFTPDSKRLVLHNYTDSHGENYRDPRHQYFLCDLEDAGKLTPLTEEANVTAPVISPDGQFFYYFVNETDKPEGRLTLKRRRLTGGKAETVAVVDGPVPGTQLRIFREIYTISTIRADGKMLAIAVFLGDGSRKNPDWGLLVFNLETGGVQLILHGPSWCNLHAQYCRTGDAEGMRDILIQENHGCLIDPNGQFEILVSGRGADIHVIRDDGTDFRTMAWGRDGVEFCQGHQCWRGQSRKAITSTVTVIHETYHEHWLVEGEPNDFTDHLGKETPKGIRNVLSRDFAKPHFMHFATERTGNTLISDYWDDGMQYVYLMKLGAAAMPAQKLTYLLNTQTPVSGVLGIHTHPFLSPDGTMGFFNSCESGATQAYMIRNLPSL